jgi:hypothetical protein
VKKFIEQHDPQRKTLVTDLIGPPALVKEKPADPDLGPAGAPTILDKKPAGA